LAIMLLCVLNILGRHTVSGDSCVHLYCHLHYHALKLPKNCLQVLWKYMG
jgi:hypothetical protein